MYDNLQIIGKGGEATIYKYNDEALKVFADNKSEKNAFILKKFKLDHFIMPNNILYKDNKYIGYTMKLLDNCQDLNGIKKEILINNLKEIKKEILILSLNGILIKDLIPKNSLLQNNILYFIDTSLYEYKGSNTVINMSNLNMNSLYKYLGYLLKESTHSLESSKILHSMLPKDTLQFIRKEMKNDETIKTFSMRLIKNH